MANSHQSFRTDIMLKLSWRAMGSWMELDKNKMQTGFYVVMQWCDSNEKTKNIEGFVSDDEECFLSVVFKTTCNQSENN